MKFRNILLIIFILIIFSSFVSSVSVSDRLTYINGSSSVDYWNGNTAIGVTASSQASYPTFGQIGDSSPTSYYCDGLVPEKIEMSFNFQTEIADNTPNAISFWVNPDSLAQSHVIHYSDGVDSYQVRLDTTASDFFTTGPLGTKGFLDGAGTGIPLNQWSHIVAEYNGTYFNFYVNGTLKFTFNEPTFYSPSGGLFFCKKNNNVNAPYTGGIDVIKFYNNSLGEIAVKNLYDCNNESGCGIPPIVADYTFTSSGLINYTHYNTVNDNGLNTSYDWTVNNLNQNASCYYLKTLIGGIGFGTNFKNVTNVTETWNYSEQGISSETENNYSVRSWCKLDNGTEIKGNWFDITIDNKLNEFTTNLDNNNSNFTGFLDFSMNSIEPYPKTFNITQPCGVFYINNSIIGLPLSNSINITNCSLGYINSSLTFCDMDGTGGILNCLSRNVSWNHKAQVIFNATSIIDAPITNFAIYENGIFLGNTTTGSLDIFNISEGIHNFTLDGDNFAFISKLVNVNLSIQEVSFTSVYTTNSLNLTFFDSETGILLNYTTISVQFVGLTAQTNTTTTGTLFVDLFSPDTYTILSDSAGYQQNKYIVSVANRSFTNLNIYLQNSSTSSLVLITVTDRFGNELEGVEIIVQKWLNNAWVTDQIYISDFQGQTEAYYILSTTFYNHVLKYEGSTVFGVINGDENKKFIFTEDVASGIKFTINTLGEDVLTTYLDGITIDTTLNFTNTSTTGGYFRYYFSNPDNFDVTGCLTIYKGSDFTLLGQNCSTTGTGIIFFTVNQTIGTDIYYAKGSVNSLTRIELIKKIGFDSNKINWGVTGYIFGFFVVALSTFAFLSVPSIAIIIGSVAFILLIFMGVIFQDMNYTVLIIFLFISYLVSAIKSRSGVNA